jgi:hypothetical protein
MLGGPFLGGFNVDENNLYEACLFLRNVHITIALCKSAFSETSHCTPGGKCQIVMQFGYFIGLTFREFLKTRLIPKLQETGT